MRVVRTFEGYQHPFAFSRTDDSLLLTRPVSEKDSADLLVWDGRPESSPRMLSDLHAFAGPFRGGRPCSVAWSADSKRVLVDTWEGAASLSARNGEQPRRAGTDAVGPAGRSLARSADGNSHASLLYSASAYR
jgi:hypothetical protein